MYAIIRAGGHQYRAEPGAIISVERMTNEVGESIELTDVLLVGDGDKTVIGQPNVEGAVVKATVLAHYRARKIIVFKYRQRTNYRRKSGHRQHYTRLRIEEITA